MTPSMEVERADPQVKGDHYEAEYQHWDLVADCYMGYFDGQITRYICRWRYKDGVWDLEKAAHYTRKYRKVIGADYNVHIHPMHIDACLERFFRGAKPLGVTERSIITLLAHSHDGHTLDAIEKLINTLIEEAGPKGSPTPGYVNQGK